MNETEKNIRKLLIDNEEIKGIDVNLEDSIMNKINSRTDYDTVLIKTKYKAKIGIISSLILLVIYSIATYVELLTTSYSSQFNLTNFYPAIFTALVVIVVYVEMTYGVLVFRKNVPN